LQYLIRLLATFLLDSQIERRAMMGSKQRRFTPLTNVSLEELVPHDHFYRHLERTLDLSFVREFVQQAYAGGGRPSIDPVVFFMLQRLSCALFRSFPTYAEKSMFPRDNHAITFLLCNPGSLREATEAA